MAASFVIAVLVGLVFFPILFFDFVAWDDPINIYQNPHIKGLSHENLAWMFSDFQHALRYKPLSWLTWAIIHACNGLNPFGYHFANLVLHVANSILFFFILMTVLNLFPARTSALRPDGFMVTCAGIGALLWGLHPLRVEPVAWATGLPYDQAVFFLLISFLFYLEWAARSSPAPLLYLLSFTAFCFSLLSYPIVLGYAGVLLILDGLVLGRLSFRRDRPLFWRVILEKVPFALVTGAFMALALYARINPTGRWSQFIPPGEFGFMSRLAQAFYIWGYYLWKPLLPWNLCPVYTQLTSFNPATAPFVSSGLLVIAISVVLIAKRKSWPGLTALWFSYLMLLIPVLGLTEHPHFPSDRYGILAGMTGPIVIASGLMGISRRRWRGWLTALSVAAVAALGIACTIQTGIWRNSFVLFRHTIEKLGNDPYRSDIYFRLGALYAAAEKLPEAVAFFEEAVRITPKFAEAHCGLADAFASQKRLDEAKREFLKAIELAPGNVRAHYNVAMVYEAEGDLDSAVAHFFEAVRIVPENPDGQHSLAVALATRGDFDQAVVHFMRALQAQPDNARLHYNLGLTLRKMGRESEAAAHLSKADQLDRRQSAK